VFIEAKRPFKRDVIYVSIQIRFAVSIIDATKENFDFARVEFVLRIKRREYCSRRSIHDPQYRASWRIESIGQLFFLDEADREKLTECSSHCFSIKAGYL